MQLSCLKGYYGHRCDGRTLPWHHAMTTDSMIPRWTYLCSIALSDECCDINRLAPSGEWHHHHSHHSSRSSVRLSALLHVIISVCCHRLLLLLLMLIWALFDALHHSVTSFRRSTLMFVSVSVGQNVHRSLSLIACPAMDL